MKLVQAFAAASLVAAIAAPLPSGATTYRLSTGEYAGGWAYAINDANQIVGDLLGSYRHAFLADGDRNAIDLGTLGGNESSAIAVSENGLVAGFSDLPGNNAYHAFLYQHGVMTDLGTLGGSRSFPYAVNSAGDVVGSSWLAGDTVEHAFLYRGGTMIDLGTLGGTGSVAYDVSESGEVVGSADLAGDTQTHAFSWSAGTMTDLGTLGGSFSEARALNEAGAIVGTSKIAGDAVTRAFLYSGGTMQDLGTLGGNSSEARGVNESNTVIGRAEIAGGVMHAFVWSAGVMTDLAASVSSTESFVGAVNDNGEVAGLIRRLEAGTPVERAFTWSAGTLVVHEDGFASIADDINNAGHTVGAYLDEIGPDDPDDTPVLLSQPVIWLGPCGNGTVDPAEDCDDSNFWNGDCCSAACEAAAADSACTADTNPCSRDVCNDSAQCVHLLEPRPAEECIVGDASSLQVRDSAIATKDRVTWRWSSAGPVVQSDLGNPHDDTTYDFCVWDYASGAASAEVHSVSGSALRWISRDPRGWIFRGGDAPPSGLRSLQIKLKSDGSAAVKLIAGGESFSMPTPVSPSSYFAMSPSVVVQLVASNGLCLTSEFSSADRNDGERFSAETP